MKKTLKILFIFIFSCLMFCLLLSCQAKTDTTILINGDIVNNSISVDLGKIKKVNYTNQVDGKNVKEKVWEISTILQKIECLSQDNWLFITADDGVSVKIDMKEIDNTFILANDKNKLSVIAPDFPRAVGIKDIKEITIIAKQNASFGIKEVTENKTTYLSFGNAKLFFYEMSAENKLNDKIAYKYIPKKTAVVMSDIFPQKNIVAYFTDFDIIKNSDNFKVRYENGKLLCEKFTDNFAPLFGVVCGTEILSYDSFYVMKETLAKNKRVLFILPDGLSYEQVTLFNDNLTLLNTKSCQKATTVNPAISNVSLATILTGKSPFYTKIIDRPIQKPALEDIFKIATDSGKTVSYVEGNGNLLMTSTPPILSVADENGMTDNTVFSNAMNELDKNNDLTFVHFHGIDDINHIYGSKSLEAKNKILETENYISKLLQKFNGVVIIVPDHGHIDLKDTGKTGGKHGLFQSEDMYIPYYVWEK